MLRPQTTRRRETLTGLFFRPSWPVLPDKIDRDHQLLPQDKYSI
jgi:hypothetical protein